MSHASTWINPQEAIRAASVGRGRGIKIAVIDSGIELSHPWLRHVRLVDDVAFEENAYGMVSRIPGWGADTHGHGTAVAYSILRAAPEAQVGSFRVLDSAFRSKYQIVEEAARVAIERGYHIINCSFGSKGDLKSIVHFKSWIDYAYTQGVHVVSACNNIDFREPEWPGFFPSVITVNMAKTLDENLYFRRDVAKDGNVCHLVEFAARGVELELPSKGHRVDRKSGSSFAAPHVTGILARLLSVHPRLKPLVAKSLLQEAAKDWTIHLRAANESVPERSHF